MPDENLLRPGAAFVAQGFEVFSYHGRSVLLCRGASGVYAVENRCPHQETELAGGRIRGDFIFCPLHGARFDLRDGRAIGAITKTPLQTYKLRMQGDAYEIETDETAR